MKENIDSVLTYWFGSETDAEAVSSDRKKLWWSKDEAVDEEIRDRFAELTELIAAGELDHWRDSPQGLLASIICLDQFSRNMYRSKDRAFAHDDVALALAKQAVTTAADQSLEPIQRVFIYMPFEHSEDIEMQNKAVALFEALAAQVDDDDREVFKGYIEFARRHQEIIERFGRFPHRNAQLGRDSTEEELAFLEQPGSSF